MAISVVVALTMLGAPAPASAAPPYPGTIETTTHARASRTHIPVGAAAYAVARVRVGGNAYPQGRMVVIWDGNTGKNYRMVKYKSQDRVVVGPAYLPRGTYDVRVYYFPTQGSVYQRSSDSFTQVVMKRRAYNTLYG